MCLLYSQVVILLLVVAKIDFFLCINNKKLTMLYVGTFIYIYNTKQYYLFIHYSNLPLTLMKEKCCINTYSAHDWR